MGGNLGLFGDFEQLNAGPVDALAANSSIVGVGIDPEGIDNNPVFFQSNGHRQGFNISPERYINCRDELLSFVHTAEPAKLHANTHIGLLLVHAGERLAEPEGQCQ
eukprot:COSAG02_NODE_1535_length_12053_cov_13.122794_4_plen_106_part_00